MGGAEKLTDEQREAALAAFGEPKTLRQKIAQTNMREFLTALPTAFIKGTVDTYAGLRKLGPVAYVTGRNGNDAQGAVKALMEVGTLKFNGSVYDIKDETGGLIWDVIVPMIDKVHHKTEANRFMMWMVGGRLEDLKAKGLEHRLNDDQIRQLKTFNEGTLDFPYTLMNGKTTTSREAMYADTQAKYNEYVQNQLDNALESGIISKEAHEEYSKNKNYVPTMRMLDDDGRSINFSTTADGLTKQKGWFKLRGGAEAIKADLWQNVFDNLTHITTASLKNKNSRTILDLAEGGGYANKITGQQYEAMSNREKQNTEWVMIDGKKQYYDIGDDGVLTALRGMQAVDNKWTAPARMARRIYQYGVTASPWFTAQTLVKDQIHSPAVTSLSLNIAGNFKRGISELDGKTPMVNFVRAFLAQEALPPQWTREEGRLMAGGGLMSRSSFNETGFHNSRPEFFLNTPNKFFGVGRYIMGLDKGHRDIQALTESVTRMSVYLKEKADDPDIRHDFAVFAARDVQDYGLRGSNPYVKAAFEMMPFATVHNIGLYKMARGNMDVDRAVAAHDAAIAGQLSKEMAKAIMWGSVKKLAMVYAATTMVKLANDAWNMDDPDYQKRTENDHNTNFWFKALGEEWRFPMGFEVGSLAAMSANFIEAISPIGAFRDKEMTVERAFKNMYSIGVEQLGYNFVPQIVRPIVDVARNVRSTGGPIETTAQERIDPQYRYTSKTTLPARAASTATGGFYSPVQLDYMAQAYGGWLATMSLGLADTVIRQATNEPKRPEGDIWASLTNNRVRTDTPASSRYVNMLYEQGNTISSAYMTYKELLDRGRIQEAQGYLASNRDKIIKYNAFEQIKRTEGDLNEAIRMTESSRELTPAEKRERIKGLTATKNTVARSLFVPQRISAP
jgi:hypothetical protein